MYSIIKKLLPELFDEDQAFDATLPKSTRFQILITLATVWAFVFASIMAEFIAFGITAVTSTIAHILIIGAVIYTRKSLNNKFRFGTYHSVGRSRTYMIGLDGKKVKYDKDDPGGEHE
jgi:hypothetical protein